MNKNTIGKVNAKHGTFYFCHFDEYIGLSIREYGEYSELELKTILEFINEGDTVFDVGANIGCFSVPFAKKVGSNGKVYAFEPQPFINKLLKKNIQENNLDNVKIIDDGLGAKNQTLKLDDFDYTTIGNFGGISLSGRNNLNYAQKKTDKKHRVRVRTLNEFIDLQQCNFLKIDVEGHELECLESIDFSSYEFGIIGVEIGPGVQEYHKIVNYLENFGYQPFFLLGPDTLFCHPDNLESSTKLY